MLIKGPNLVNVYRPASFADCILKDGEVSERKWRPYPCSTNGPQRIFVYKFSKKKVHGLFCK